MFNNAVEVAADIGIHYIFNDVGILVSPKVHADYLLGHAFHDVGRCCSIC